MLSSVLSLRFFVVVCSLEFMMKCSNCDLLNINLKHCSGFVVVVCSLEFRKSSVKKEIKII